MCASGSKSTSRPGWSVEAPEEEELEEALEEAEPGEAVEEAEAEQLEVEGLEETGRRVGLKGGEISIPSL